jgi:hypothetical protein
MSGDPATSLGQRRPAAGLVQQVARPFLTGVEVRHRLQFALRTTVPMGAFPLPGLRSWGTDGTVEKPAWTATHRPDGE